MRNTAAIVVSVLFCVFSAASAAELDTMSRQLLRLTPECGNALAKAGECIALSPVVLPRPPHLVGVNDHFGWPVATQAGKALIVVFHRKPQHAGGHDKPDAHTSTAVVVRSLDGGKKWSDPVNLWQFAKQRTEGCRLGFGNSIGTDSQGRVVLLNSRGVFRSADEGATWEHLTDAYGETQLAGRKCNNGPRLLYHPGRQLLVAAGHPSSSGSKNPDGRFIDRELWLRMSADGGESWREQKIDLPEYASAVEPTLLWHEGLLLVVARCHSPASYEKRRKTWRYVQLWSDAGWPPLRAKHTTMRTSGSFKGFHGPWSQDTVHLDYNPVTRRIEAVATNRDGGGPKSERANVQTLNLWSIAPENIDSGEWRFEASLLTRDGKMTAGNDGMHPGGAVLDRENRVRHIFIYAGRPSGPAGIFRISHTLDTPALVAALRNAGSAADAQ